MWMYQGPTCFDRPFCEELSDMEINTWILRVHAHGVVMNLGTSPPPYGKESIARG
jgi:hypothetical protein